MRIALLILCFLIALPAYAAEGTGILKSQKDGALGKNLWEGSERHAITTLIRKLPVSSESPAVQSLIRGVLLGEATVKGWDAAAPGEDLLTLRLKKLLEAGMYQQALDLFTAAESNDHHPETLKAGIMAMLGAKEASLACIESKTFDDGGVPTAFWASLRAYCDFALEDDDGDGDAATLERMPYPILQALGKNKELRFSYDQESFSRLSRFEQVILIAKQRIEASSVAIADVPQDHISALLAMESVTGDLKLRLTIRAAELGLIGLDDLTKAYNAFEEEPLPALYLAAQKAEDKITPLKQALEKHSEYSDTALAPFAPFFKEAKFEELAPDDLITLLRIFHRAEIPYPPKFVQEFLRNHHRFLTNEQNFSIFAALFLNASTTQRKELSKIIQKNEHLTHNPDFFTLNVIENLDKALSDVDNAPEAYEKDFILTSRTQHAMPSKLLWNRLNSVAQEKVLGETALLSIYVLHEQTFGGIYPGLFHDVLSTLKSVGLTKTAKDLAIERFLSE